MDTSSARELKPNLVPFPDRGLPAFGSEEKDAQARALMHALLARADRRHVEDLAAAVDALQEFIAQNASDTRPSPAEMRKTEPLELSVVIPCLNERETIGNCVCKA